MDLTLLLLLPAGILLIAFLYSSVGHGGASGYLALMAILSVSHLTMRPAALLLNILVASIAAWHFIRAGYFSTRIFIPFALASVPAAFIGGTIVLGEDLYKPLVGVVLLYGAYRLFRSSGSTEGAQNVNLSFLTMFLIGAGIGLVSGLTGVGGGIFLSPLLLLAGLCNTKTASGVAALFVLVNSVAGLAGTLISLQHLEPAIGAWLLAAGLGGLLGARFGSRVSPFIIRRLLSIVLIIAGLKMVFT
ncbi:MAG: sulfite exporter TauE/SafE family protein [Balneolaceae bacterium]|nr:sulfite exporter TauE/SafE family protein [Balneolaceae bacterium]MCH8547833.1 sulfite exporter TauE/SafE family protein [Balneolaceae bacterium]